MKKDIPEKEKIDTLINPLVFMLESVMQKYRRFEIYCADDDLFTKLLRIVTSEHNTRITMKELSGRLNCSVSTLSHLFKKRTGLGITEYVEKLRLQDARWLRDIPLPKLRIFWAFAIPDIFCLRLRENTEFRQTDTEKSRKQPRCGVCSGA